MHAAARSPFATVRTGRFARVGRGQRQAVLVATRRDPRRFGTGRVRFDPVPGGAIAAARSDWASAAQTFAAAFLFLSVFLA